MLVNYLQGRFLGQQVTFTDKNHQVDGGTPSENISEQPHERVCCAVHCIFQLFCLSTDLKVVRTIETSLSRGNYHINLNRNAFQMLYNHMQIPLKAFVSSLNCFNRRFPVFNAYSEDFAWVTDHKQPTAFNFCGKRRKLIEWWDIKISGLQFAIMIINVWYGNREYFGELVW